jgi:hypothetical protein
MSDPRRLFLLGLFLCLFSFPEAHGAEAGARILIQGAPEPERQALPRRYLIALADYQEETAESVTEKAASEDQTPRPKPGPVLEKPAREPKATVKTTIATPKSAAVTSPLSSGATPGASLTPQKAAPTARTAAEVMSDENAAPSPQPSSLIRVLEEREDELMLWLTIAITFFIVGWICGGNFYLRRERKRSRKLRF